MRVTPSLGRMEDNDTHQSTVAPLLGWEQTSDLTVSPAEQQKLPRRKHRENALQFGATASLAIFGLTQLKPKSGPLITQGPNLAAKQ